MTKGKSARAIGREGATLAVAILLLVPVAMSALWLLTALGVQTADHAGAPNDPKCKGTAACFSDRVRHIVDGDTLDVGLTRVRLALVNTPEAGLPGYAEAKQFTVQTCPVGLMALVDEDDGQARGSYGRTVGLVYCSGVNLNAASLSSGNAVLVPYYCNVSEFASETWTGCP